MPIASIIIPTKDRPGILRQSLEYIQRAIAGKDIEVIVVNDGQANLDLAVFPFAILLKNTGSGVASARNLGVAHAGASRLILLDDDMLVFPENIDNILALTPDVPDRCINLNWIYPPEVQQNISKIAFGRYLIHYGFTTLKGWNRGNTWQDDHLFETSGITSQFLYISRKAFDLAGGYTESFPFAGFEDHDLARKLSRHHIKFYIDPRSTCWHNELDRLTPENWLERKKRGAQTRKHAVRAGHPDLELKYTFLKRTIYSLSVLLKPIIFWAMRLIPNQKSFDFLYFRCVNLLLGTVVYEGYRKS
jgi:glycosyltransferase involved in cell wall biosynthesis